MSVVQGLGGDHLAVRGRNAHPFVWRVTTRVADAPLTGESPLLRRITRYPIIDE